MQNIMLKYFGKLTKTWWGKLLLVSLPFSVVLFPSLFGLWDISFGMYEESWFQYLSSYQQALRAGESLFWDPNISSGFPQFVSPVGGFFSPLFFVVLYMFSVPAAYHLLAFLNLAISAWVVMLIAERVGMKSWGQWVAGLTYGISAWSATFNIVELNVLPVLPVLVLMLLMLQERFRRWPYIVGGIVVFQGWIATHWALFFFHLIGAGIVGFYLSWRLRQEGWRRACFPLWSLGVMVAGGTLLGLVQLIPTLVYMPLSVQFFSEGISHAEAIRFGLTPLGFILFILPFFDFPFFLLPRPIYLGILPLFFIGIAFTLKKQKDLGWRRFFSWFLLLALLFSLDQSPLFWILHHVPPISFTHGPDKLLWVIFFAGALLAGFGADLVRAAGLERRNRFMENLIGLLFFTVGTIAAFITVVRHLWYDRLLFLITAYFDKFLYTPLLRYSATYYHTYINGLLQKALSLFDVFEPTFFVALLFLGLGYGMIRWMRGGLTKKSIGVYLVGIFMAVNYIMVFFLTGDHGKQEYFRDVPPTAFFLKERLRPGERLFSFLGTTAVFEKLITQHSDDRHLSAETYGLQAALISPDLINLRYGIAHTEYGGPLAWISAVKLISYLGSPAIDPTATTTLMNSPLTIAEKTRIFAHRRPVLNLLGVRYITSAYPLDESIFSKVFETVATSYKIPVYIYENVQARPLYYFTAETELLDIPATITPTDLQQHIENLQPSPAITQKGIAVKNRGNAFLDLQSNTPTTQLLVFSQNNLPGWRARIDGERIPIHTFATVYQAVFVPEGEHEIRFSFSYWEIWREFARQLLSGRSFMQTS